MPETRERAHHTKSSKNDPKLHVLPPEFALHGPRFFFKLERFLSESLCFFHSQRNLFFSFEKLVDVFDDNILCGLNLGFYGRNLIR